MYTAEPDKLAHLVDLHISHFRISGLVNIFFAENSLVKNLDHLCYFCLVLFCFLVRLFVDALWSSAGKGMTSWLSFVMSNCDVVTSPSGTLGQVRCLIVLIPDLCPLSYFHS